MAEHCRDMVTHAWPYLWAALRVRGSEARGRGPSGTAQGCRRQEREATPQPSTGSFLSASSLMLNLIIGFVVERALGPSLTGGGEGEGDLRTVLHDMGRWSQ